jgi:hypothetical protein
MKQVFRHRVVASGCSISVGAALLTVGLLPSAQAATKTKTTSTKAKKSTAPSSPTTIAASKVPVGAGSAATPKEIVSNKNPAVLKAFLVSTFGAPNWWPVPDVLEVSSTKPNTFQEVRANESISYDKTSLSVEVETSYYVANSDMAAANALVKKWLASSGFDLTKADTATNERDGRKSARQTFRNGDTELQATVSQTGLEVAGPITGVVISLNQSSRVSTSTQARSSVPALNAMNGLPVAPGAEFYTASASLGLGVVFGGATGYYSIEYKAPLTSQPGIKKLLADPSAYKGELKTAGAVDASGTYWTQTLKKGQYGGDVTLFPLEPSEVLISAKLSYKGS